jgi:hypothetical protein
MYNPESIIDDWRVKINLTGSRTNKKGTSFWLIPLYN